MTVSCSHRPQLQTGERSTAQQGSCWPWVWGGHPSHSGTQDPRPTLPLPRLSLPTWCTGPVTCVYLVLPCGRGTCTNVHAHAYTPQYTRHTPIYICEDVFSTCNKDTRMHSTLSGHTPTHRHTFIMYTMNKWMHMYMGAQYTMDIHKNEQWTDGHTCMHAQYTQWVHVHGCAIHVMDPHV